MSYNPTTWHTGDVVTSAKLNNIEQGIVSAGLDAVIVVDASSGTPTPSLIQGSFADLEAKLAADTPVRVEVVLSGGSGNIVPMQVFNVALGDEEVYISSMFYQPDGETETMKVSTMELQLTAAGITIDMESINRYAIPKDA